MRQNLAPLNDQNYDTNDNIGITEVDTLHHKLYVVMEKYKLKETDIELDNIDINHVKSIYEMIVELTRYVGENSSEKYDLCVINEQIKISTLIEIISLFFEEKFGVSVDDKLSSIADKLPLVDSDLFKGMTHAGMLNVSVSHILNFHKKTKTIFDTTQNTLPSVTKDKVLLDYERLIKERGFKIKTDETDINEIDIIASNNVGLPHFIISKNDLIDCLDKLSELYSSLSSRLVWKERIITLTDLTSSSFKKYCAKREEYNYKLMIQTQLVEWTNQYNSLLHLCNNGEYKPVIKHTTAISGNTMVDTSTNRDPLLFYDGNRDPILIEQEGNIQIISRGRKLNENKQIEYVLPTDKCAIQISNIINKNYEENVQFMAKLIPQLGIDQLKRDVTLLKLIFNQHYKALSDIISEYAEPNKCKICLTNEANNILSCGHIMCPECIEQMVNQTKASSFHGINNNIDCPYCKKTSKKSEIKKIYY